MPKKIVRLLSIFAIILVNVSCDQISKQVLRETLSPGQTLFLAGGHFIVTSVENTGAFLSLGDSLTEPMRVVLLCILPLAAVLAFLIYILLRPRLSRLPLFAFCCMLGGGIGNLIDRIRYGSVTDFMHIDLDVVRTGIFNAADVSIMLGIFILLFHGLFKKRSQEPHSI